MKELTILRTRVVQCFKCPASLLNILKIKMAMVVLWQFSQKYWTQTELAKGFSEIRYDLK